MCKRKLRWIDIRIRGPAVIPYFFCTSPFATSFPGDAMHSFQQIGDGGLMTRCHYQMIPSWRERKFVFHQLSTSRVCETAIGY